MDLYAQIRRAKTSLRELRHDQLRRCAITGEPVTIEDDDLRWPATRQLLKQLLPHLNIVG